MTGSGGDPTLFWSTQCVVVAPPNGLARHSAATALYRAATTCRTLGSVVPKYSANLLCPDRQLVLRTNPLEADGRNEGGRAAYLFGLPLSAACAAAAASAAQLDSAPLADDCC